MTRTRFAPSPTGLLHIGNLRTAVYAYAMAKHDQGQFILRIEDTDQKRYKPEGIDDIKNTLSTFKIKWDEFYIQSERKNQGIYQKAAKKLVASGNAFFCNCAAKNAKEAGFSSVLRDPCRDKQLTVGAVKLKVPDNEQVSYFDFVLNKNVSWDTNTVYDATLLKSDGYPTYHLAAMTDDLDMHISHILRGHDWMPSTPIHLLVFKYLGGSQPQIGHLTDILSPQGGKLSKRRDAMFCASFLTNGYLPEALLNFVLLLGWAPKDNQELFTLEEFVQAFDPKGFQKANPMFLTNKLDWFNGHYIRQKTDTELTQLVKPFVKTDISDTRLTQIIPLIKERITKLDDINNLSTTFVISPEYTDRNLFTPNAVVNIGSISSVVQSSNFGSVQALNEGFQSQISQLGEKTGNYFMDFRVAMTGSRSTPPITETALALGKEETLKRLENAKKFLNRNS